MILSFPTGEDLTSKVNLDLLEMELILCKKKQQSPYLPKKSLDGKCKKIWTEMPKKKQYTGGSHRAPDLCGKCAGQKPVSHFLLRREKSKV